MSIHYFSGADSLKMTWYLWYVVGIVVALIVEVLFPGVGAVMLIGLTLCVVIHLLF